jgi:capsule polysaccharide modification protein KpsS
MQKKTILFFSRCELVHLYGKLHKYLIDNYNIVHVAYSEEEAAVLVNDYGLSDILILKNEFILEKTKFKLNNELTEEIDRLFINQTDGRFTLNGSIQSDRTFLNMDYDKALEITAIYHNVWKNIFSALKVDFFIHEPTSLMINHMASVLCKQQGGVYSTHIMVQGEEDYNFIMVDHDNGYPTEFIYKFNSISDNDIELSRERVQLFLEKFRSSYNVFFDVIGSGKPSLNFYLKIYKSAVKEQLSSFIGRKKIDRSVDNIEYFLNNLKLNSKRINNFFKYRAIKYDEYVSGIDFYFYPLHLEPEAVVLYWAEGFYTSQVKLIENIAAQLPPNVMLYVKDHPHLYGYRDVADYKRIQDLPNVKLLAPSLPGKKIVNDSKGVITLNGTAGLEALLLNKQIITFGSAFYKISERVKYVRNIKDFKDVIYKLRGIKYEDDYELYKFVLAYLNSQKVGFTDFYGNVANEIKIDMETNIKNVANGLNMFFKQYDNYNND